MIKKQDNITTVEFSKNKKGAIRILVSDNNLVLQTITGDIEVGEECEDIDFMELPKTVLTFHNEKSIDAIISQLERIKHNLKHPKMQFYLAC